VPDGYGVGLFDSSGPEKFAASIGKITAALTGVQSAFNTFGSSAGKSISSISQLVDSLTKSLSSLQKQVQQVQSSMGGMGGGGGGGGTSGGGGGYGGGSGGTGAAGKGAWLPPGTRGDAGPATGGGMGGPAMPTGGAGEVNAQLKDQWARLPEGTGLDAAWKAAGKMTNAGNGGQAGGGGLGAGAAMVSGAIGSAANVLSSSAAQNLIANAVQGQFIGASLGPSFGRMTGRQQQGAYVIPRGAFAQSAGDYAQANMYMANYMGADPFGGQSVAGQNANAFNRGAQQLMTMMPSMTRQQAMVTQNAMQQPGVLNAGLMFGLNFKPGGKAMDTQSQFGMIYQKLFAGFPGGKPNGDQFESYMSPGGPGENNLAALGITPGSDAYSGFMQYARARIGMASQGKDITKVDLGTKAGAKAAGFGKTAAYAQLNAQTAKSRMESQLEPGIAGAAKNLNEAAAALLKAATPLASLGGSAIGKLFGGNQGLLGGITSHIPGMGFATGMAGHLPGVGGIIKSIFQQGGEVPGSGPQLAVVHGGEFVLTKEDVEKMRGKKGGHGGGAGISLTGLGAGGGKGSDKSILSLLAGKPTDNEVSTTVLGMLFSPPPPGSILAGLSKHGADFGVGKTAAPAQGGGKGNGGTGGKGGGALAAAIAATAGMTGAQMAAAGYWSNPATGAATPLGAQLAVTAGAGGGKAAGSAWNYKSAGIGPNDLSGMFLGTGGGAASQTSDGSGSGAGGSGGTGSGKPTSLTGSGNAQQAYNFFISKGLKDYMAAGILGNLAQESGINPGSAQAGGPGRGIAQWSVGGRWDTLVAWAKAQNRDPNSLATQLDFMWSQELNGTESGSLAALKGTSNVSDATTVFEQQYERAGIPAMSNRIKFAQNILSSKGAGYARGTQLVARTQLAMLHRGEAVVPAADNYSSSPYNKGGAVGGSPIVQLNFKPGSVVLQVPANASQQDMDAIAKQFVAAVSKPQNLMAVRSS